MLMSATFSRLHAVFSQGKFYMEAAMVISKAATMKKIPLLKEELHCAIKTASVSYFL